MFGRVKNYFNSYLKPKEEVTIEDIFRPMYILLSIFGLFPYSIKFHKTKNYFSIVNSSLYLNLLPAVCCLMVILTFFALHMQALFLISEKSSFTDVLVTQMNYVVELVLLLIFCHVAYAHAFINRYRYVRMLNTVISAWSEMPFQPNSQVLSHLQIKSHFVMIGGLTLILCIHLIVNTIRSDGEWKIVLVTVTFILPQMMQYIVIAFLNIMVLLVITILQNARESLLVTIMEKNHCGEELVKVESKTVTSPTIRQLELSYAKAYQIKRDINISFQASILVIALQAFHAIVSEAHIIYHGVVVSGILNTHEIVNCTIWIVWQLLKIYLLAYAGNSLKTKVII